MLHHSDLTLSDKALLSFIVNKFFSIGQKEDKSLVIALLL